MSSPSSSCFSSSKNHHRRHLGHLNLVSIILFLLLLSSLFPLSSSLSSSSSSSSSSPPSIGVSFNPSAPGIPSHDRIVSAIGSAGINHVLLHDPDPQIIRSFLYTNISLLISLPLLSSNRSFARHWLSSHLLPFHPRIRVTAISLGRIPITADISSSASAPPLPLPLPLLPALRSFRYACADLGLPKIPISTVHSLDALSRPFFPPSSARFQENLTGSHHIPNFLEFLSSTGSPFLVDLYPFALYRSDPAIPIGYALFTPMPFGFRNDPSTGLAYRNLFDAMVDAVFAALEKVGYRHLQVVVTATGWPTQGADEATAVYACRYNRGLAEHLRSGLGTPMRSEGVKAVYVRELFDDAAASRRRGRHGGGEPAAEWESHWGIWFANLTPKYELDLSGSDEETGRGGGLWAVVNPYWCCWILVFCFLSSSSVIY